MSSDLPTREIQAAHRRHCGVCNQDWDWLRGVNGEISLDEEDPVHYYLYVLLDIEKSICPYCEGRIMSECGEVDYDGDDI